MREIDQFIIDDVAGKARLIRRDIIEMLARAGSGHTGGSLSAADIVASLYFWAMNVDPARPAWEDRDRFVLSKGHAAPVLYAALAEKGFFPREWLDSLRKLGSPLQGHPDRLKVPGVEASTGSLGQGISWAVGMALAGKMDQKNYRVYALLSDGECNEGSIWEAALIAANLKLTNLIALVDWNRKSSYGTMAGRNDIEPLADKWRSFGWAVLECDGHDFVSLTEALAAAEQASATPTVLLCHTVKGKGIPYAEVYPTRSNFALTAEQDREAVAYLDTLEAEIKYAPFTPGYN